MAKPGTPIGVKLTEEATLAVLCHMSLILPEHWVDNYFQEATRLMAKFIHANQDTLTQTEFDNLVAIGGLLARHSVLAEEAGGAAGRLLARIGGKP